MYVILERPMWEDYDATCYFAGWVDDPKYGTPVPAWCAEVRRSFIFQDKEDAELLAQDFTDYFRMKFADEAVYDVLELEDILAEEIEERQAAS